MNESPPPAGEPKPKARRKGAAPDDVGKALRSAYDEALREEVPDDFLDLLGKLS
ncbi:NepR family anti-sigma factor [Sphingomonas swuensis]